MPRASAGRVIEKMQAFFFVNVLTQIFLRAICGHHDFHS